jgi:RNA polymerase sigma factor (sigma-70 family)
MELSSSQRKHIEHQFDSFCKRLLKNEAKDYRRGLQYRSVHEVLFSEMFKKEIDELMTMDRYESDIYKFLACGFEFEIESDLLAAALSKLPVKSRDILLLSYFLDMSDVEIANALGMARSTVQYRRSTSLNQLKKYMGGKNNAEE